MFIKYCGENLSKPELQIPGWAGKATDGNCQPWHLKQFTDSATAGVELVYPHEDVAIPEPKPPFTRISDLWYLLETDLILKTPDQHSVLVLPHYRFYTDANWETPLPVATMVDTDWWPNRLKVIFKLPPPNSVAIFRKGEPYAQLMVVPRNVLRVEEMSERDVARNHDSQIYTHNAKNLITREWITSTGYVQDNLYEVLSHLERRNKKYKVLK